MKISTKYKDKYKDVEDRGLQWDLLKMEITGFTVMYSKSKAKQHNTAFAGGQISI